MAFDVSSLFGGQGATAGYPNTDYPAMDFTGPSGLQPKGGTAEVEHNVTPADRNKIICTIAVIVVLGYALWHFNYIR